jgi:aminopeptidase N
MARNLRRPLDMAAILTTALCTILTLASARAEAPFNFAATPGKLPKTILPLAYRLDLVPSLDALTLAGKEEIDVEVTAPTDTVTLDADKLTFDAVTLEDGTAATITLDATQRSASFHFPQALSAGRHTLKLAYSGAIPQTPSGLYYNDFKTAAGPARMLVTQFEFTDARDMMPCWDEPAFKASFHLTVTVPKDLATISNTPVEREKAAGTDAKGKALKRVTFGVTPKMSSYLLVLAVGPLDRIETKTNAGEIGAWAAAGKAEQGRYALTAAAKILPYYNDYFGVKYPLPKLDLIAVPGNFAAGGMENWGGITFIDNALLFDPKASAPATQRTIFNVTAHEMAHQWSGDLVTMAWWDNTWLNEGFANWMADKASDHFNPSWNVWVDGRRAKEIAMGLDARPTSHPIQVKIDDESEILTAFDSISYNKGEALIRMIETYLGENTFRDGMRRYMKAHEYSNATTADLWAALSAASGKPVAAIAAGFTEQPGIPLIRVATACEKNREIVTLTQDRFTIHDPSPTKLAWQVPVELGEIGGDAPHAVLVGDQKVVKEFPDCAKPVQANYGDTGYYRVQYEAEPLKQLIAAYSSLPAANRAALIADQWALVEAGRAEPANFLDLTEAASGETERPVLALINERLDKIDRAERGGPDQAAFHRYAAKLLHPAFERLGWARKPEEANDDTLLRARLIGALGRYGDEQVIAECRTRFEAFLKDPASLSPDIADPVITTIARYADQATWDKLRALGKAASGTEEKLRYYLALARVRDPALIDQTVQIAYTDELSAGQVPALLFTAIQDGSDPAHVWQAVAANPEPILQKLPESFRDRVLSTLGSVSGSAEVAAALQAHAPADQSKGARYEMDRSVDEIQADVELRQRLQPPVGDWLRAHGGA